MPAWPESDMEAHALRLTAGAAPHPGVEVGMVLVDGELYVRAFRGPTSAWFRAAVASGHGQISVGNSTWPVNFSVYGGDPAPIDDEYLRKYGPDAAFVTNRAARESTLRIHTSGAESRPC